MINNIWLLIYKKLNGGATLEQLEELDQRIKEDANGSYPVEMLDHIWKNTFNTSDKANHATDEKWNNLEARLKKIDQEPPVNVVLQPRGYFNKYQALIAATLLIVVGLYWFSKNTSPKKDNQTEIAAPLGAITKVQLPDGSTVTLNAGSKITYPNSFSETHRELHLSGEAYFDVVKDREHPFIVTTQTIRIKVLGTRFNVKAYTNDRTAEAALFRGSIELTVLKNPDRQILLKPSEKITITNARTQQPSLAAQSLPSNTVESIELSQIHQNKTDSLPSEAVWMESKIVFEDQEFMDIAKMMERKYDTEISFTNEDLKHLKFTGKFLNIPLDEALKQLQVIANFTFKIKNKKVFITK